MLKKSKAHEPINYGSPQFHFACAKSQTIPTKRQLNKWERKYGKAWHWHTVLRPIWEAQERERNERERLKELLNEVKAHAPHLNDPEMDVPTTNGKTPRRIAWEYDNPGNARILAELEAKYRDNN